MLELIGIEDSERDGFITLVGLNLESRPVEGATPKQALEAVRAEQQLAFRYAEPLMSGSDGPFTTVGGEQEPATDLINGGEPVVLTASNITGTLTYPDGNPKTAAGMKKPDLSVIPPVALLHLATAMMNGANKYGPFNWRDQAISYRPYLAAAMRHCASCLDGEDFSQDTVEAGLPVHHLGHVMACCAIVLDAIHCGMINDNRPKVKGDTGNAIERYNVDKVLLTPAA